MKPTTQPCTVCGQTLGFLTGHHQTMTCPRCGTVHPLEADGRIKGTRRRPQGLLVAATVGVVVVALWIQGTVGNQAIEATVNADGVLGSYTAYVGPNDNDTAQSLTCTVSGGGGTDTFSVTLQPDEGVEHQGKVPMEDFTSSLSIECG